jgi:hypothetical protein
VQSPVEDLILNRCLFDLTEEIRLKAEAMRAADTLIAALYQELELSKKDMAEVCTKLETIQKRNQELEDLFYPPRNLKTNQTSKNPTPRMRAYLTECNNKPEQLPPDSLKLISHLVFSEFALNFESLLSELGQWPAKEKDFETESLAKLETRNFEVS